MVFIYPLHPEWTLLSCLLFRSKLIVSMISNLMFIYIVTSTSKNYTLIPQTDEAIVDACRHLLGQVSHIHTGVNADADQDFLRQLLMHNQRGEEYLVFDTNGKSSFSVQGKKFIRNRFSYISDAPYSIWPYIIQMDRRSVITYSDQSHRQFLDDIGYKKPSFFMPHGGPLPVKPHIDFKDRDINVLVLGRVQKAESLDDIVDRVGAGLPDLRKILDRAFEKALSENLEPYLALKSICLEGGIDLISSLPHPALFELLKSFYRWMEMTNRNKLLQEITDVKIDFVGPIRDEIAGITDRNHNFHHKQLGEDCLKFMDRAKVVLNSVTVFPDGSHERIWFAMAHGAAVFTDYSRFVAETFRGDENILFIDNTNHRQSVDRLKNAMESGDALATLADKASAIYPHHHTWEKRLGTVLPQVGAAISSNEIEGA